MTNEINEMLKKAKADFSQTDSNAGNRNLDGCSVTSKTSGLPSKGERSPLDLPRCAGELLLGRGDDIF